MEDYTETASEEEGVNDERSIRKKRMKRDTDSDMEKRRKRTILVGEENRIGQGSAAITPPKRYHVANHEKRASPIGRISVRKEEADHPSEGSPDLDE